MTLFWYRLCVWTALVAACLLFWLVVGLLVVGYFAPAPRPAQPVEAPAGRTGAPQTADHWVVRARTAAGGLNALQDGQSFDGGVPQPPQELGTALFSAVATWCAPTKSQCQAWGGDAHLAAVHSFRQGDPEYLVRLIRGNRSTVVRVVSFCLCRGTDNRIDLSVAAWRELEPNLGLGVIRVLVEGPLDGGPLPHTDTSGGTER